MDNTKIKSLIGGIVATGIGIADITANTLATDGNPTLMWIGVVIVALGLLWSVSEILGIIKVIATAPIKATKGTHKGINTLRLRWLYAKKQKTLETEALKKLTNQIINHPEVINKVSDIQKKINKIESTKKNTK